VEQRREDFGEIIEISDSRHRETTHLPS
jgi:hypothetical protein